MNRKQRRAGGKTDPARETALLHQAAALQQAGRLAEADQAYDQLLAINPKNQDGLHLRGTLHYQANKTVTARDFIKQAIRIAPKEGVFWASLALVEEQTGDDNAAEQAYAKAVKLTPDHAEAWNNFGAFLAGRGRFDEAVQSYGRAVEEKPDYLQAIYNLGVTLLNIGELEAALAVLEKGLGQEPGHPDLLINYGVALERLKRFDEAEAAQKGVLEHLPDNPGALTNLSSIYFATNRLDEAEQAARSALAQLPELAPAWNNLGNALSAGEQWDEAEAAFRKAIKLAPRYADAHGNLANLLSALQRHEDASISYAKAMAFEPHNPRHPFQLAVHHLITGQLEKAWPLYEAGFACGERQPNRVISHPAPRWRGEDMGGKCLHIWPEQGIGDEVMLASLFEEARNLSKAGRVVIECDERLIPAFNRAFPWAEILPDGSFDESAADAQIPMMSLCGLLRNRITDFPAGSGFLTADPALSAKWRERLDAVGTGPKIGISWSSGLVTARRSSALSCLKDWTAALEVAGLHFVNLQYGDREAELREVEHAAGISIHRWEDLDLKSDIEDVLALIGGLDLVLHMGTSAGAFAGALGVPCWMLRRQPEWSQFGTDGQPFYPATKVYGRRHDQSWRQILDRVALDLAGLRDQ